MDWDWRNTPSLYRMSRRSRVSLLRTHSPTTFPEGTGIQKIPTNPITRIQVNGRRPDQSISLASIYYCAPSLGSLEDRWGYCYDFTSFSVPLLFSTLTLPIYGYLFFSFFSFLITHMLAHVLIHVQPCLLMCLLMHSSAYSYAYSYAYSAYSYTVVVQYTRTGWTPLFGS